MSDAEETGLDLDESGLADLEAVRDRIVELRRVPIRELRANPKNFRAHPQFQRSAMRGALKEIGWAAPLLAYEHPKHGLTLIDGHLRQDLPDDAVEAPVVVLDVTPAEADKVLATFDAIGGLAEIDSAALTNLLGSVTVEDEGLRALLTQLADEAELEDPEPPEEFPDAGEGDDTNQECPKCGYVWAQGT